MASLEQTRHLVTEIPGPGSLELNKRRAAAVSHGVGITLPVFVARAGGGIVEDVDGNRLIDLGSGIAVTTIGNSSPRVVDAVRAQVADFTHTCFMVTPYESYIAVAEELNRITPGSGEKRSVLFNSGAEAVENAIKVARSYTRKPAVAAFDHAYHGRTNMAMALTAKSMPYKSGFGPFAPEIYRAPMSYPYRDGLLDKELATDGELAAARAISVFDKQIGAANLAAVIIEPIQGEGGFIVPAEGFLPALLEWCRKNDVVFYLELKYAAVWGMDHALVAALQKAQSAPRTIVISFDPATLTPLRRLDPSIMTGLLVEEAKADCIQAAVDLGSRQLCPKVSSITPKLVEEAHRAGIDVARANDVIAGAQHGHQRRNGRHSRGKGVAARSAFECRQRRLQPVARGVSGARIIPAAVAADAGEFKRRGKVNRDIDRARQRVRLLPGMDGKGRVSVLGHDS